MFKTIQWGTYIFFAGFLAASIVWIYFFLPETKGATLEEMDRVFGSRTGEEDAIMLEQARRDVGLGLEMNTGALKARQLAEDNEEIEASIHERV
jgi:hypothetical protein